MDSSRAPRWPPACACVRRGRDHLQVGLYDGRRALLPRTAAVERTLARPCSTADRSTRGARSALTVARRAPRAPGACLTREPERDLPCAASSARVSLERSASGARPTCSCGPASGVVGPGTRADVVLVVSARGARPRPARPARPARHPHLVVRLVDGTGRGRPVRRARTSPPACAASTPTRASTTPTTCAVTQPLRPGDRAAPRRRGARRRRPGAARASPSPGRCATWSPTSTGDGPPRGRATVRARRRSVAPVRGRTGPGTPSVDVAGPCTTRLSGTMGA